MFNTLSSSLLSLSSSALTLQFPALKMYWQKNYRFIALILAAMPYNSFALELRDASYILPPAKKSFPIRSVPATTYNHQRRGNEAVITLPLKHAQIFTYAIDVEIGDGNWTVLFDTGSSITWLARPDFTCLDLTTGNVL